MTAWVFLLGLILAISAGAEPGASSRQEGAVTGEVRDERAMLRVTLERSDAGLRLRYELRNTGKEPLLMLNRLYFTEVSGHYRLAPERVYAQAESAGAVVLSKALLPIPKGLALEAPEVPCVTRLEPGAELREELHLASPLQEELPYQDGPGKQIPVASVKTVRFRVGYLVASSDVRLISGQDSLGRDFAYPAYGAALSQQVVLDSGPLFLERGR